MLARSILNEGIPTGYQRSVRVGTAQPEPKVKTWIAAQNLETLFISVVSFGELRKGIVLLSPGKRREVLEAWVEADLSILFSGRVLSVTSLTDFPRSSPGPEIARRYTDYSSFCWTTR